MPRETACFDVIPEARRDFQTRAGMGPAAADAAAREFVANGARGLISFGVAGGLSSAAPAGSVVVADHVIDGAGSMAVDPSWAVRIRCLIGPNVPLVSGRLVGSDRIVSSPEGKKKIFDATAAVACDMESHAMARVAQEFDIPFVVIRAISDPYDSLVPAWVPRCLTPTGEVKVASLIGYAAPRPWTWPHLIRLSKDVNLAFASLRGVARGLGPGLGFGL